MNPFMRSLEQNTALNAVRKLVERLRYPSPYYLSEEYVKFANRLIKTYIKDGSTICSVLIECDDDSYLARSIDDCLNEIERCCSQKTVMLEKDYIEELRYKLQVANSNLEQQAKRIKVLEGDVDLLKGCLRKGVEKEFANVREWRRGAQATLNTVK